MNQRTLAILSGIGASAGLHMATRLVEVAQEYGAKTDADFPHFLLYNLPITGTDEKGVTDAGAVVKQLSSAIERLSIWGCGYLLIACNTAHYYIPELRHKFDGTIINMVDLACRAAVPAERVGVICSVTTRESALYGRCLEEHNPGVSVIYPTDVGQDFINIAIDDAITGKQPGKYWKGLHALAYTLQRRGADRVILGCTELPLCLKGHAMNGDVIDAGELAVHEAFRLLTSGAPGSSP